VDCVIYIPAGSIFYFSREANRMCLCLCLTRVFKMVSSYFVFEVEQTRDVSFISDEGERVILQDAIQAVNSVSGAWAALRAKSLSQTMMGNIRGAMKHVHDNETFSLILQLLVHMSSNWTQWVENRKRNQNSDLENKNFFDMWRGKHKWTENSNNVLLLAYLENIYSLCADRGLTNIQRLQYGVEKVIFDLEVSLARINLEDMEAYKNYLEEIKSKGNDETKKQFQQSLEYKLEICKRLVEINLPGSYQHCKKRWSENNRYIEVCEEMRKGLEKEYNSQYEAVQRALKTKDMCDLENALYKPLVDMSRIRETEIYEKAFILYNSLRRAEHLAENS